MKLRTKIDTLDFGILYNADVPNPQSGSIVSDASRLVTSSGNPRPYKGQGSDFVQQSFRQSVTLSHGVSITSGDLRYTGKFCNSDYKNSYTELDFIPQPPESSYTYFGSKGIDRFSPVRPIMDLGTSLAELRDVSQLKSLYRQGAKRFSDMYLDFQFGRGAIVRDLVDLVSIQAKLEKALKQLARDNGKTVIRSGQLSSHSDVWSYEAPITNGTNMYPVLTFGPDFRQATIMAWETIADKWWFSGHFRYYVPELTRPDYAKESTLLKAKLLGLTPSLSLAWNILPWSWMIDWFGSVGSILSNIDRTREFHQVNDMSFVMYEKIRKFGSRVNMSLTQSSDYLYSDYHTESSLKSRAVASPYGFGINPDQFNDTQVAILSALGISKSKGRLFHP